MKTMEIVFERQVYTSNDDGTVRVIVAPDKLRQILGQALSMRAQFIGFRMTPDTEVKFKMWESCYSGLRPSELRAGSGNPFWTSAAYLTLRPAPENIAGPFGGDVEFTMEVRKTVGSTIAEVDGMFVVTLFLAD